MRRTILSSVAAVACIVCLTLPAARAQQPTVAKPTARDSTRMTVVTYVSGQSVYVSAGRSDGVREEMTLEVVRGSSVIATMKAAYLSSRSASCTIVTSSAAPVVGDSVRYHPSLEPITVAIADSAPSPMENATRPSWRRPVRGHIGVGYLNVSQPNAFAGGSMRQPSADVYLEATGLGGTPVGIVIDSRTRHTVGTTRASALDDRTLIYQVSVSLADPGTGTRMSVGRQYSTALSSVSLFDGITAELNRARWGVGVFGGVQPDVQTMGYSNDIREAGGYVQLHNDPGDSFPWSLTTGGAESRDVGQLNREFGFVQLMVNSRAVSVFASQEVDLNRGWKRTVGEPGVSPTSTFATLTLRPTDVISLDAGMDNRRSVRLYRDYVNPVTEFDDAYRQGWWAGASARLFGAVRIGGNTRVSRGGPAGGADYYTGSIDVGRLSRAGIEVHLRSTSYSTDWSAGWLHALSASIDPFGMARFEISGGLRTEHDVSPGPSAPTPTLGNTRWIGASIDVSLGASWYLVVTGMRDGSGLDVTNQLYTSVAFRF